MLSRPCRCRLFMSSRSRKSCEEPLLKGDGVDAFSQATVHVEVLWFDRQRLCDLQLVCLVVEAEDEVLE